MDSGDMDPYLFIQVDINIAKKLIELLNTSYRLTSLQSGDKICWETLSFWAFLTSCWLKQRKIRLSLPHPLNAMLKLPVENNKHINFGWSGTGRGRGGDWIVLLFKVTPSDDNVSKRLSPIVDFFVDWNISGPDIIIKNTKDINKLFLS